MIYFNIILKIIFQILIQVFEIGLKDNIHTQFISNKQFIISNLTAFR